MRDECYAAHSARIEAGHPCDWRSGAAFSCERAGLPLAVAQRESGRVDYKSNPRLPLPSSRTLLATPGPAGIPTASPWHSPIRRRCPHRHTDEGSESESEPESDSESEGEVEEKAGGGVAKAAQDVKRHNKALRSEVAAHKAELEKLREQDPEFYQYLQASAREVL